MNFWQQLSKPFLAVAPMADVTDVAFRRMLAKYSAHTRVDGSRGGPDVMWTEFVSADGLMRATVEGKQKLMADLLFHNSEQPVVAQLFSSRPEYMEAAASLCRELGFSGIDINMGCPDRGIEKQGCGSAMIKTPEVAAAVIAAAKRGARTGETDGIPVSVKTRLGYGRDQVEDWIPFLLEQNLAALSVHARIRQDMSKVPARWERMQRVVELRNQIAPETLIVGNGDVLSREDGLKKIAVSGADGAMVGRALFGNPWFFHPERTIPVSLKALPTKGVNRETLYEEKNTIEGKEIIGLRERLEVLVEHSQLFSELLSFKNFAIMKKHYKAYVSGFAGAAELRVELMAQDDVGGVQKVVENYFQKNGL